MGTDNTEDLAQTGLHTKRSPAGAVASPWCGGPADWQKVAIRLPDRHDRTPWHANEFLGVSASGTRRRSYATRVRIAYDVATTPGRGFPANLDPAGEVTMGTRARAADDERGMTLIELLVAMTLLGVVSSLVVVGVQHACALMAHTDDENRGLQDAKVILDRLSRDIRQARGVVCDDPDPDRGPVVTHRGCPTRCPDHVQLWIDDDSDYLEDPDGGRDLAAGGQRRQRPLRRLAVQGSLARATRATARRRGPERLQASALIVRTLFNYDDGRGSAGPSPRTPRSSGSGWTTTRSSAAASTSSRPPSPCASGTRGEWHADRLSQAACGRRTTAGIGMILVIGIIVFVAASPSRLATIAMNGLGQSRQRINFERSLAAAESGIDYALGHLQYAFDTAFADYPIPSRELAPDLGLHGGDRAAAHAATPRHVEREAVGQGAARRARGGAAGPSGRPACLIATPIGRGARAQAHERAPGPGLKYGRVYARGWSPAWGDPRAVERTVKVEYVFMPYRPKHAILTGSEPRRCRARTCVDEAHGVDPATASVHTNGNLTVDRQRRRRDRPGHLLGSAHRHSRRSRATPPRRPTATSGSRR